MNTIAIFTPLFFLQSKANSTLTLTQRIANQLVINLWAVTKHREATHCLSFIQV